jgi:hypothetical protein
VITEETLAELERLSASSDDLPWAAVVEGRDAESGDSFIRTGTTDRRGEDLYVTRDSGPADAAHLDLIAAARTYLPLLVEELRAARTGQVPSVGPGPARASAPPAVDPLRLTLIGYWAGPDTSGDWPSAADFVDPGWDADDRSLVVDYLRQGQIARAYMGWSRCRLCGEVNGDLELTDGTYVWPSGLVHYVEDHDVRVPQPFVAHAEARTDSIEQADRDEDWWSSARPEPPTAVDAGDRRSRSGTRLPEQARRTVGDAPSVPAGQVHLLRVVDDLSRELAAGSDGHGGDNQLERFLRAFSELLGGAEGPYGSAGRLVPLDPWMVVADALREAGDRR